MPSRRTSTVPTGGGEGDARDRRRALRRATASTSSRASRCFIYNLVGVARFRWEGAQALAPGKHTIELDFKYDGPGFGKGGTGVLSVDGKEVARRTVPHTVPFIFERGRDLRRRLRHRHPRRRQGLPACRSRSPASCTSSRSSSGRFRSERGGRKIAQRTRSARATNQTKARQNMKTIRRQRLLKRANMRSTNFILLSAMFVAALMAASCTSSKASTDGIRTSSANHRHAGFTQRHHDHRRQTTPAA